MISHLDPAGRILSSSRVLYNFLHLPTQEFHYAVPNGSQLSDAYQARYTYRIAGDDHARNVNYAQPVTIEQFHYVTTTSAYEPLRRVATTYDDFGCILQSVSDMWDRTTAKYIRQNTILDTYSAVSWGGEMLDGEMLESELFIDEVSGFQRRISYLLTADQKNIATSVVTYRASDDPTFTPWKSKSYTYDQHGRITTEQVAWAPGASVPEGTIFSYMGTVGYGFDATTGTSTITATDPQANSRVSVYSTRLPNGPIVSKTMPLGETETFAYDALGRLTTYTDPFGNKTMLAYSTGAGANFVTSTNSLGYKTQDCYDTLGRQTQLYDNGDSTQPYSTVPNRLLSDITYDGMSRVATQTNELGLVTSFDSYDAFNRRLRISDSTGNVITHVYDDSDLTAQYFMNGDLRSTVQLDGFSRPTQTRTYADSADQTINYCLASNNLYNGFDEVTQTLLWEQPLDGSGAILLEAHSKDYDPESRVITETMKGKSSPGDNMFDVLTRNLMFDLFGNMFTYTKTVKYSNGESFSHPGPQSIYNDCNRLITSRSQLGQEETYVYNENGFMTGMIRYDGTKFAYSRDAIGRMTEIEAGSSSQFTYLANGRLSEVKCGDNVMQYNYTLDGSTSSVSYPDGRQQQYKLDKYCRVVQNIDPLGTVRSTSFDDKGRVSSRTCAGDTISYSYGQVNHCQGTFISDKIDGQQTLQRTVSNDGFGRHIAILTRNLQTSEVTLNDLRNYDSRGRLRALDISSLIPLTETNYQRQYIYDGLGQLASDTIIYTGSLTTVTTFSYDGNCNVISTTVDGLTTSMNYNALDQRTDEGFTYDMNGRLLSDSNGRTYSYNENDQLSSVTVAGQSSQFQYSPDDSLFVYQPDDQISLYYDTGVVNATASDETTGSASSFLLEPGRRVASYEGNQRTATYFIESEGSTALLIGKSGAQAITYQAYGRSTSSSQTSSYSFGYRQELTDKLSGLIYLRSRFYQPDNFAFTTMDSLPRENRYTFCEGDPINLFDGSGHLETAGSTVGLVVGIAITAIATLFLGPIFGGELIAARASVGAVSGALSSVGGDAARAAIQHEHFSAEEAGVDLLSGALGGAIGSGSGELAGRQAGQLAVSRGASVVASARITLCTTGVVDGSVNSFTNSVSTAALTNEPIFTSATALSTFAGAAGGFAGGYRSFLQLKIRQVVPTKLVEPDVDVTKSVATADKGPKLNKQTVKKPLQNEDTTENKPQQTSDHHNALQSQFGEGKDSFEHLTVHGAGNTLFGNTTFSASRGILSDESPSTGNLFAQKVQQHLESGLSRRHGNELNSMSASAGWTNAQTVADATNIQTFAWYPRVTADSKVLTRT